MTTHTITVEGKSSRVTVSEDRTTVDLSVALALRYRQSRKARAEIHAALAPLANVGAAIFGRGEHLGDL